MLSPQSRPTLTSTLTSGTVKPPSIYIFHGESTNTTACVLIPYLLPVAYSLVPEKYFFLDRDSKTFHMCNLRRIVLHVLSSGLFRTLSFLFGTVVLREILPWRTPVLVAPAGVSKLIAMEDEMVRRMATAISHYTICQMIDEDLQAAGARVQKAYQQAQGIPGIPASLLEALGRARAQADSRQQAMHAHRETLAQEVENSQKALLILTSSQRYECSTEAEQVVHQ